MVIICTTSFSGVGLRQEHPVVVQVVYCSTPNMHIMYASAACINAATTLCVLRVVCDLPHPTGPAKPTDQNLELVPHSTNRSICCASFLPIVVVLCNNSNRSSAASVKTQGDSPVHCLERLSRPIIICTIICLPFITIPLAHINTHKCTPILRHLRQCLTFGQSSFC